ncbi:MAG: LysM peptidoglycan-binding domain-containing protein [Pseudomonadota bacterium]
MEHPLRDFRQDLRRGLAVSALALLAACGDGLDMDMRSIGNGFDTTDATQGGVIAPKPVPDARGVISYPTYQVALAERGDTVSDVAARVGVPAEELAAFNGIRDGLPLRQGEILALPRRVPEMAPGGIESGALGDMDVAAVAGDALNRTTDASPAVTTPPPGEEPIRHQVAPGETAFSIARLYGVTPRSLAEWNNLGPDFAVRAGQFLLIPVTAGAPAAAPAQETQVAAAPLPAPTPVPAPAAEPAAAAPGQGSVAPPPPSAAAPLPAEDATPEPAAEEPASPQMAEQATEASDTARFVMPVSGSIIRAYEAGTNDGVGIAASAGTQVKAADEGTVAAITRDADQVPILVLRHEGNLLTVYAGVDNITVEKGDSVSRGQAIAAVREGSPSFVHFEVRDGFESVDPMPYLN